MKKLLSLFLTFVLCFSLCACNEQNDETQPAKDINESVELPEQNDSATQTQTDLTKTNTLVIDGKDYALPISTQEFINSGWNDTYEYLNNEIDDEKVLKFPAFSLDKNGKSKISGVGFYNNTGAKATLADCNIISLKLVGTTTEQDLSKCSFTLPGGITENSSYDDVIAAYDSELYRISDQNSDNNNSDFMVICISKDSASAPYNYTFSFNADKTIKYVDIESINYKLNSLTSFD